MSIDLRLEQLRSVEADILCPSDPIQTFPDGWVRAAELTEYDWFKMTIRQISASPPVEEPQYEFKRVLRKMPNRRVHRNAPVQVPDRRSVRVANAARRMANPPVQEQNGEASPEDVQQDPRLRTLSPTDLPGVHAVPKKFNQYFRGLLAPGLFYVKSKTQYLGPFNEMPTENIVPAGDNYVVLQRMGQLPDSGKSIFRQVGTLST
uniref:MBD domain-containing protein n=1 Tax=Caenorhabditis tropicalis TaxID=1561998 RepID=A0A1I7T8L0_9PELO